MKTLNIYSTTNGSNLFVICNAYENGNCAEISTHDIRFLESIGYKAVIN